MDRKNVNNNSNKVCGDIIWIVCQVVLTFILSKCCNLKNWSEISKLTYILVLLVVTVYTWFFDIKKIIGRIYEFIAVVCTLVWLVIPVKEKKEKTSNDYIEFWIVISCVLKVLYISMCAILITALLSGNDKGIEDRIIILGWAYIFIFLCITIVSLIIKEITEKTRHYISIFLLIVFVILQLARFKELFAPVILTIIIPTFNWYFSKERLYFYEKTEDSISEEKKEWGIYKTHFLIFSVAVGIVIIVKDMLSKNIKDVIFEKLSFFLSPITSNLFNLHAQRINPNMVMLFAVALVYLVLLFVFKKIPKGIRCIKSIKKN